MHEKTVFCLYEIKTKKIFSDPVYEWSKIFRHKESLNKFEGFRKYDIAVIIDKSDGTRETSPEGLIFPNETPAGSAEDDEMKDLFFFE